MTARRRPDVWLVTPAYRRYELTKLCLEVRAWTVDYLRRHGIDATCCVIADDANARVAESLGFAQVRRVNDYLGAKFNDGYEYAAVLDATHVMPLGSDSWLDPRWIVDALPWLRETLQPVSRAPSLYATRSYSVVDSTGLVRGDLRIDARGGTGWLIPTWMLGRAGWRPCSDYIQRGCDGSTLDRLEGAWPGLRYRYVERHPLEYMAFQSPEQQITSFDRLWQRYGVKRHDGDAFKGLARHYPSQLVKAIRDYYDDRNGRRA